MYSYFQVNTRASRKMNIYNTERKKRGEEEEKERRICFQIIRRKRIVSICFMSKQENAFRKDDLRYGVAVLFILIFRN